VPAFTAVNELTAADPAFSEPTLRVPLLTDLAVTMLALKFPEPSRFTIAFAVFVLVGATVQFNPRLPLPVTGEPLTVNSEAGALRPTLVTVPVPLMVLHAHAVPFHCNTWLAAHVFSRLRLSVPLVPPPVKPLPLAVVTPVIVPVPENICPVAKVKRPLLLSFKPVSAGALVPEPNSRFRVPEGVEVLLPEASAFHWKVWFTAEDVPLLNEDATKSCACEGLPPLEIAMPIAGAVRMPWMLTAPFTSSVATGVVVPMPIFAVDPLPVCDTVEFWMFVDVVQRGIALTVPPVVVTFDADGGSVEGAADQVVTLAAALAAVLGPRVAGVASTNADGGNPLMVCASPAFKA